MWIPRYEYLLDETAETIKVNFLENTENAKTKGYKLQPAFGTDKTNGGWNKQLEGIWVAKFAARICRW